MKQSELKVGDKVHYIPFEGCDENQYENGKVKEIPEHTESSVRVVYNCNNEWNTGWVNYTSALTSLLDLRKGWR